MYGQVLTNGDLAEAWTFKFNAVAMARTVSLTLKVGELCVHNHMIHLLHKNH